VKVFGVDPGSDRTGYGCIETDGSRHRLIACGAIATSSRATFPEKLLTIHEALTRLLAEHRPDCVAVESVFYAANVRSALTLGHARGIALLAAVQGGYPVSEYAPAEIKRAVVGYGRAEKHQVGEMVRLLLGLDTIPEPHDAADALAIAICHVHSSGGAVHDAAARVARDTRTARGARTAKSWREYRP
jgi:crossover junction endodeoxyribonuclease RuvC